MRSSHLTFFYHTFIVLCVQILIPSNKSFVELIIQLHNGATLYNLRQPMYNDLERNGRLHLSFRVHSYPYYFSRVCDSMRFCVQEDTCTHQTCWHWDITSEHQQTSTFTMHYKIHPQQKVHYLLKQRDNPESKGNPIYDIPTTACRGDVCCNVFFLHLWPFWPFSSPELDMNSVNSECILTRLGRDVDR